ncbi:hypothetical protein C4579_00680 [Candidatus Microgenomates bacterium]|nr:MAG: hypothetical protein C4579_00680 [Candidatus Microgenomates bacterium]
MTNHAFKIIKDGKTLDYRIPGQVSIPNIQNELVNLGFENPKLQQRARHVIGTTEQNGEVYFVKIATSEGISLMTQREAQWNNWFHETTRGNAPFLVPVTIASGYLPNQLFYLVSSKVNGNLLIDYPNTDISRITPNIENMVTMAVFIESLPVSNALPFADTQGKTAQEKALSKTIRWFEAIPDTIRKQFELERLLNFVKDRYLELTPGPRHGDFTPWHMFENGRELTLIDGEHASTEGVKHYDLGYMAQRLFSVLKKPELADAFLTEALKQRSDQEQLRTIMAMRAIGGFLDESLTEKPDFSIHEQFARFLMTW